MDDPRNNHTAFVIFISPIGLGISPGLLRMFSAPITMMQTAQCTCQASAVRVLPYTPLTCTSSPFHPPVPPTTAATTPISAKLKKHPNLGYPPPFHPTAPISAYSLTMHTDWSIIALSSPRIISKASQSKCPEMHNVSLLLQPGLLR
jgi:hypothetical protein